MSAFVVDDKTINTVLAWIRYEATWDHKGLASELQSHLAKLGFSSLDKFTEPEKVDEIFTRLGFAMFTLNCEAVNQRYSDAAEQFRDLDYKYKDMRAPSDGQALKSLNCWHYQCAEGNIPDTDMYQVFDKIESTISRHMATESSQYKEAVWG